MEMNIALIPSIPLSERARSSATSFPNAFQGGDTGYIFFQREEQFGVYQNCFKKTKNKKQKKAKPKEH